MLEIFDHSRRRTAIAENAYSVTETQRLNAIWKLSFSLPYKDPKNEFCKPFSYVRYNGGELYRIMPSELTVDETGGYKYQCEHVLAALLDNVIFDYHIAGGLNDYTEDVIRYILSRQIEKNWQLAECDFRYRFEYGWENENLLAALFSVATPFAEPYIWKTDTKSYPWKLSLKRLNTSGHPELYVRRNYNLMQAKSKSDPQQLTTRLYPLGYGEGINQLNIKAVNNGVPYLQSPSNVVSKYGIIERVWIDRRYENPETLKAVGQAILKGLQEPRVTYEIGFQELKATGQAQAAPGVRLRIICPELHKTVDTYITEVTREFGDLQQSTITVANQPEDIAASISDLMDKQRIEQAYAQGATQLYSQALQTNGSPNHGVTMDFFIPSEMRIVNKVLAKIRLDKFRAYSKTTTSVSQNGRTYGIKWSFGDHDGNVSITTEKAGKVAGKLDAVNAFEPGNPGGFKVYTSRGILDRKNKPEYDDDERFVGWSEWEAEQMKDDINYDAFLPVHYHTYKERSHRHGGFIYPAHNHKYKIPGHYHRFTLPKHLHSITPGIYRFGDPRSLSVWIDGVKKVNFSTKTAEIDLTNFLIGSDGKIPRGKWFALEIRPNDLAYISIVLVVQGFIQSRGGINA